MRVSAYAKINLSLRVVGLRSDGYHELRTIFQSIALHDSLTVRVRRGPFTLECDDPNCPTGEANLVWRAAERVWAASGRGGVVRDLEIQLAKRIPIQAGLGGGSSDAAAVLRACASLWRVNESTVRDIAVALGADVPYFLEGGTVLGLDRGDTLYSLVDAPSAWVTLVLPPFGVSTPEAFSWWDRANRQPRPVSVSATLGNDLEAPVAAHHHEIVEIADALRRAGALYAAMSGSGSAVFGLFERKDRAERAARSLASRKDGRRLLVTRTLNRTTYQRLAGIKAHRINLPFAPRSLGHS
jgi:4-diphosphocytidyl-2-C-methyl-D-erythritol kinase